MWPKCLNNELIKKNHSFEKLFHIAGKKFKSTLADKFFIQGYTKVAQEIIANCSFCNLRVNLPKQKRPEGLTFELKIPFRMWAMDYVILDSRWPKTAALTLTDPFSGYTIYISCSDKISDLELIKLLYERVFAIFGLPCALRTDQQYQMSSYKIRIRMLRIKKYVSSAGRQNASERQHKLLLSVFAAVNKKKTGERGELCIHLCNGNNIGQFHVCGAA